MTRDMSPKIPRQEFVNPALFMTGDDCPERGGEVGKRINGTELARLYERGNCPPVLCSSVMSSKQGILPAQGNRPDGSFDGIVVDLDPTVCVGPELRLR